VTRAYVVAMSSGEIEPEEKMKPAALVAASLLVVLVPAPGSADRGHERPKITVMRWEDPPVTAHDPSCSEQGTCSEETLIVRAHDPDSSITEIQVWFDENGERAPFVFAHTYCVQGRRPGKPARLEIPATFTEPGDYTVAAVAYSHRRCLPHERGDRHEVRHSRVKRLETKVVPSDG
jgi:hypothetical protein